MACCRTVGIFLAFLAARFAVLLVVLAALTVVFLVGLGVARLVGRARRHALGLTKVGGLLWRPGVYYSPGHAWLQWKGTSRLRVGLDDLAQHLLSHISEVTLPAVGQVLRLGEPTAVVRCGRRRARSRAGQRQGRGGQPPAAAQPVAAPQRPVRPRVALRRGAVGRNAHSTAVRRAVPAVVLRESHRFSQFLEHQLGLAVADGGELVAPGPSLLTEEQWKEMAQQFLASPAE